MKYLTFLSFFFLMNGVSLSCQEPDNNGFKLMRESINDFYLNKKDFNNYLYERYIKKGKGASIYGIYNKIDSLNLQQGIYGFSIGNHFKRYFLIYDTDEVEILDTSSKQGLKNSIKRVLEYSIKRDFCAQIINDYVSKLMYSYYVVNNNPTTLLDINCKSRKEAIVSSFLLKQLKVELAEHLINNDELENLGYFMKYPEFFIINNVEMYFGLSDDEFINNGIYYFLNSEKENPTYFYLLISDNKYEVFDIKNFDNLNIVVSKVLDLGEHNNFCNERTKIIIQKIINSYFDNSCFDDNLDIRLP